MDGFPTSFWWIRWIWKELERLQKGLWGRWRRILVGKWYESWINIVKEAWHVCDRKIATRCITTHTEPKDFLMLPSSQNKRNIYLFFILVYQGADSQYTLFRSAKTMRFITIDQDNDISADNCAVKYRGGGITAVTQILWMGSIIQTDLLIWLTVFIGIAGKETAGWQNQTVFVLRDYLCIYRFIYY